MHGHLNVELIRKVSPCRILKPIVCLIRILIINNIVVNLNI